MTQPENKDISLTPEEYLDFAIDESRHCEWSELYNITVTGNVHVLPDSGVKELPRALIQGSLYAGGCRTLEKLDCKVEKDAQLSASGASDFGPNFSVGGDLFLRKCASLKTLNGLFRGSVDLSKSGIVCLDSSFSCSGDLRLRKCQNLESLDCEVLGSVEADGSSLSRLGRNFRCGEHLNLTGCANLKKIGDVGSPDQVFLDQSGVEVVDPAFRCVGTLSVIKASKLMTLSGTAGSATLEDCQVLSQVRDFQSMGAVLFSGCPNLSEVGIKAVRSVGFVNCGLEVLSANSSVRGELAITNCKHMRELDGFWGGNVALVDLPVFKRITPGFKCAGELTVSECPSLELLAGSVGGSAALHRLRSLKVIEKKFKVARNLSFDARDSAIQEIGCSVGENMTVAGPCDLRATLKTLDVGGDARFQDCANLSDLRGSVSGDTMLVGCGALRKLGADFECGKNLFITGSRGIQTMNCRVGGCVTIGGTRVEKTGPAFECGGDIYLEDSSFPAKINGIFGGALKVSPRPSPAQSVLPLPQKCPAAQTQTTVPQKTI